MAILNLMTIKSDNHTWELQYTHGRNALERYEPYPLQKSSKCFIFAYKVIPHQSHISESRSKLSI
ncbi:unknown [Prevotella sp. CAG:924]|nr:unknown [Prevotella sp. CAG:924]